MNQKAQNEDDKIPHKPSVLSLFTRDLCELPEVYPYDLVQNAPEQAVEPVDEFIASMVSYERFHPSQAAEWLLDDWDMFMESGEYSDGLQHYVDVDLILDMLDKKMEEW